MQNDNLRSPPNPSFGVGPNFQIVDLVFVIIGVATAFAPAAATLIVEKLAAWLPVAGSVVGLTLDRGFQGVFECFIAASQLASLALVFFSWSRRHVS